MARTVNLQRRTVLIAVVLVTVLGALASLVWRALTDPPVLVRAGGGPQVCLACFESARSDAFVLRAERISRSYRATSDAVLLLRFDGGTVEVSGAPLLVGCHVVSVAADAPVTFIDTRGLLVRWPAAIDACDD